MEYKDYYKILGVAKDASADEIKKAYRKMARKYHPDISKEPDAALRMAEVNEANAVLSDPEKRKAYDQLGDPSQYAQSGAGHASGFQAPPGWDGQDFHFHHSSTDADSADYSSFFEELFGRGQRARRSGPPSDMRGQDQHSSIELEVPDSYSGGMRVLRLRGVRLDAQGHAVEDERELQVTIPKGVYEGQMIRLAGQGAPGYGKGQPGDLLLEVRFKDDKRWHAQGKDVYQQLPLAPWEAALGGPVEFNTLAGTLEINIPPGSQAGRKLRVKGKGLPSRTPGDLYLVIQIIVPPVFDDNQRKAYESLSKAFAGRNPRTGDAA
ncbi:MAG: DnaJ domain-containing protein [Comamonas sp.]|nr:DnaJ domain-containing protein [Comamonas sp.]